MKAWARVAVVLLLLGLGHGLGQPFSCMFPDKFSSVLIAGIIWGCDLTRVQSQFYCSHQRRWCMIRRGGQGYERPRTA